MGAEAMKDGISEVAEDEKWVKAEWYPSHNVTPSCYISSIVSFPGFKLHLRSKFGAGRSVGSKLPPLPLNKMVVDVFRDFLKYLLECASSYIQDTYQWSRLVEFS